MNDLYLWKNFWSLVLDGLMVGSIYALIALGYTLVYGVLRLINFAHSEVFMVGTFGALFATQWLGIVPSDPAQTGFALVGTLLVVLAVAMTFSGTTAVALERLAYRPLRRRGAPRLAALISAIGASFAISEAFALWRGRNNERFPDLIERKVLFEVFDARITLVKLLVIASAVAMMIVADQFVRRSRAGRAIRAVAQDAETATLMGVDTNRVIVLTFLIGGLLAGAAGGLYMLNYVVTKYNVGALLGIKAFTAAVLGGIGNLRGALLGGILLGLIESFGSGLVGTQWKDPIGFGVLVVVLLFRPTGLLGESLARARA